MKQIIIAIDSFKGCLSSWELGKAAEKGVRQVCPDGSVVVLPVADGGEGTVEALVQASGGSYATATVHGPQGKPVEARYGLTADGRTAILEMAAASGLSLIPYQVGNVMDTSTYGTGELIADALRRGCDRILMGIGGSATNDAGVGMLQALGFRFLDQQGREVPAGGRHLSEIASIDGRNALPALKSCSFQVAVDVGNPFYGENGAACVFAPQKGATPAMVDQLDEGLRHLAALFQALTGKNIQDIPGSGAAGGLGGACHLFLHATLLPGIEMVLQQLDFDRLLQDAALVITGEGKIDRQTRCGKVVSGIVRHAGTRVPVVALTGNMAEADDALFADGLTACFSIHPAPVTLEEAMKPAYTKRNVQKLTEQLLRLIQK